MPIFCHFLCMFNVRYVYRFLLCKLFLVYLGVIPEREGGKVILAIAHSTFLSLCGLTAGLC